ncbi:cysteine synthase [Alicyclobacillus tolerans]|uniref:cysteine synthase n=1 Tax=Alicyclobacillus tolerans TaxID=90970 RepID=UPI003B7A84AB
MTDTGGLSYSIKQHFVEEREVEITQPSIYSCEEVLREMKRYHNETVMKIGTFAAANKLAARAIAKRFGTNSNVVTIFPDAESPEEWAYANEMVD